MALSLTAMTSSVRVAACRRIPKTDSNNLKSEYIVIVITLVITISRHEALQIIFSTLNSEAYLYLRCILPSSLKDLHQTRLFVYSRVMVRPVAMAATWATRLRRLAPRPHLARPLATSTDDSPIFILAATGREIML